MSADSEIYAAGIPDRGFATPTPIEGEKRKKQMSKEEKPPKRGFLPGIWSAKDGPGPAEWRRDTGPIRGQARRKHETSNKNTGLQVKKWALENHSLKDGPELPPLGEKALARKEKYNTKMQAKEAKMKGAGGSRGRGSKGKKEDGKKGSGGCSLM